MLPDGWRRCTLEDIAKVSSGGTPDRSRSDYWGGNIPWVTTGEIGNGPINSTAEKITDIGLRNSAAKIFPAGTLLMAMYGQGKTRGRIAALSIDASTNQACAAIIAAKNSSADFLVHNLRARYEEIRNLSHDGSQKNLSAGLIKSLPILLPPLPEQRKIAEILSTWDAAISAQERLIANAKRQKKALMQTLLPTGAHPPRKRLPGFSGAWVSRVFGAIAESEKRRIDPKSLTSATKCVELEHIESETGALLGFCDARAQASLKSVFEPGYILYGKLRPYLRKFHRPDFSGVCSTEIWSIKANEKICLPDFLYYLVQSPAFGEAVDISSGSKMPRADWGIVKGAKFQLPDLNEQRAICDVLDAAETELSYSQQHLATLAREKSALMQQLLTGKRRVKAEGAA